MAQKKHRNHSKNQDVTKIATAAKVVATTTNAVAAASKGKRVMVSNARNANSAGLVTAKQDKEMSAMANNAHSASNADHAMAKQDKELSAMVSNDHNASNVCRVMAKQDNKTSAMASNAHSATIVDVAAADVAITHAKIMRTKTALIAIVITLVTRTPSVVIILEIIAAKRISIDKDV